MSYQHERPVQVGKQYYFDYPAVFTTLPVYTAHRGVLVQVTRALTADEADTEVQPMWEIQAADGWIGHAFDDELLEPEDS